MIVVVGRAGLDEQGALSGTAARVALEAAAGGRPVELVGTVGDDADGDMAVLALARAGIGHAAVLRDPAGVTPRAGGDPGAAPRLEAGDIELGLRYLPECHVLVMAEPVDAETGRIVAAAASYHGAALVMLVPDATEAGTDLPATATVLEMPSEDGGAFAALVGRYAAALADGRGSADAWQDALRGSGWEEAPA